MVKVIDDYLPEKEWAPIKDMVMNPWNAFPWNFAPETLQDYLLTVDPLDGYQFTHSLYTVMSSLDNPQVPKGKAIPVFHPQSFQYFLPFLNNPKLNCKVLIKMKLNLNPRRSTIFQHGFHVDNDLPKAKTAVFYFNDNDGYTIFEETGEKVYSKENRIVIFDNNKRHSGTTCTNALARYVLNINFYEDYSTPQALSFDKAFRDSYHAK